MRATPEHVAEAEAVLADYASSSRSEAYEAICTAMRARRVDPLPELIESPDGRRRLFWPGVRVNDKDLSLFPAVRP